MQNRLAALREVLASQGLEALLVTNPDNRYYLSGFTARDDLPNESSGTLLITRDRALLFTDFRYLEWARAEAQGLRGPGVPGRAGDRAGRTAGGEPHRPGGF